MKKEKGNWKKSAKVVIPRLVLACLLGLLVSKPLESKLFAKEIINKIEEEELLKIDKLKQEKVENQAISKLENRNQQLEESLTNKQEQCQTFYQAMINEAEGIAGSGKEGKGLVYEDQKQHYEQCQQELKILQTQVQSEIEQNNGTIQNLNQRIEKEINALKKKGLPSIFQQLLILHKLAQEEPSIAVIDRFITLLFVTIEISPLLAKLLSPYSSYDAILQQEEEYFIDYAEKNLADLKEQNNEKIEHRREIRQEFWAQAGNEIKHLMNDQFAEVIRKLQEHPEMIAAQESVIADLVQRIRNELTKIVQSISISQIVDRQSNKKKMNNFTQQYVEDYETEMAQKTSLDNNVNALKQHINIYEQTVDQFINNGHVKEPINNSNSNHS